MYSALLRRIGYPLPLRVGLCCQLALATEGINSTGCGQRSQHSMTVELDRPEPVGNEQHRVGALRTPPRIWIVVAAASPPWDLFGVAPLQSTPSNGDRFSVGIESKLLNGTRLSDLPR
jgi:hypothetical protein